jgi:O-antigen/teichoic acid export membrane protein
MIRRLFGSSLLRLFSSAVIDQAILSAANFLLGLLLIRNTPDTQYGLYVLAQSTVLLMVSANGAYVGGPLSILGSKKSEEGRQAMIGAVDSSHRRFLFFAVLCLIPLAPIGYLLGLLDGLHALVAVTGIFACWTALRRDYSRTVLLMYAKPNSILLTDVLYVVVLVAGAALAAFGPLPAVAAAVAVLALAAAGFAGDRGGRMAVGRVLDWQPGTATAYWKEMRPLAIWGTVGAVTYWLLSQSYNSIVAAKLDIAAVAAVNAARLLLMPTYLLANGVKGLLVPMSARWLRDEGLDALLRKLGLFVAGLALLTSSYFVVLWLSRAWLVSHVLKKSFAQLDMMLLGWGALVLINLVRDVYQNALLARERFKSLAALVGVSAAVSVTGMWFGIDRFGTAGVLIGMIGGELAYLFGVGYLLFKERRMDAGNGPAVDRS